MAEENDDLMKFFDLDEKLAGPNFPRWRNYVLSALGYAGLDELVLIGTIEGIAESELNQKKKRATAFIRFQLDQSNYTRFVHDVSVHEPKTLWDDICQHYVPRSLENEAYLISQLQTISFVDGNIQGAITSFLEKFRMLKEITRFDVKTLEAVWVLSLLKRLPDNCNDFCQRQFNKMRDSETVEGNTLSVVSFLLDLEKDLKYQIAKTESPISHSTNQRKPCRPGY